MISQMRNAQAVVYATDLSVCASAVADECNFRADLAKSELKQELRIPLNMKNILVP